MSTIDLERLIVRQRYFIPVKASELVSRVLEELRGTRESINGIHSWIIREEHKNCRLYEYNIVYGYVHDQVMGKIGKSGYKALVKQKSNEYNEGLPESFYASLGKMREDIPAIVYVLHACI